MRSKNEELMRSTVREYVMAKRKIDAMNIVKHCKGVSLKDRISNTASLGYTKSRADSLKEDLRNI